MIGKGRVPGAEGRAVATEAPQSAIRSVRDLIAWQKTYELALTVMRSTGGFPVDERFGLTSQLRRAAVSVPSNIAEGFGRGSRAEYVRFLYIARGSLYELTTQLSLAADLGYLSSDNGDSLRSLADECERVLWGLIRALQRKQQD